MKEKKPNSNEFPELQLSPEDLKDLNEIVSWLNEITTRQYPLVPPLNLDQIKILSNKDFQSVHDSETKRNLHPFFQNLVKGKIRFILPSGSNSWIVPRLNTVYFDQTVLENLRADKKTGYFGIGMELSDAAIHLASKPTKINSESATKFAIDSITDSYKISLKDIASEKDLEEALALIAKKGSSLLVRGLTFTILVEDKSFQPTTGRQQNDILAQYLSRPIRVSFARRLSSHLQLPFNQSASLEDAAYKRMSAERQLLYNTNRRLNEKESLEDLARRGFGGRNQLIAGYINGDIGRKIIEDHSKSLSL